jgi:hypothetical protein
LLFCYFIFLGRHIKNLRRTIVEHVKKTTIEPPWQICSVINIDKQIFLMITHTYVVFFYNQRPGFKNVCIAQINSMLLYILKLYRIYIISPMPVQNWSVHCILNSTFLDTRNSNQWHLFRNFCLFHHGIW